MRATTVTVGPLASASANNICLSQTPTAAFTLNGSTVSGGVATLDTPRRVLFTFAGADAGVLITIVGTGWGGNPQTEVLTAVSASTAYTALDFLTVTSITTASALAGAVTVGTNGIASSRWVSLSNWAGGALAIQNDASGTVNYTVQTTMQDPNSPTSPVLPYNVVWASVQNTDMVAATGDASGQIPTLTGYIRVLLNSGTGSVSTTLSQEEMGGPGGSGGGGGGAISDVNVAEVGGVATATTSDGVFGTGAFQTTVSGSPTVTNGAYAAGDVVGALITLTSALRGTSGLVQKVILNFKSSQSSQFDVLLFNANPSASTFTDNAALAVDAADFDKVFGVAHVTDFTNLGTPSVGQALNLALPVTAAATTLYAVVVARGTPTLTSTSDMTVKVGVIQD